MSEGQEQTAESDTRQQSIQDDYYFTIMQLAYIVLQSHDDLDEHYQSISLDTRTDTVQSEQVIYSPDLQGIPGNLLLYHIERYFEVYRKPITVRPRENHKELHFAKHFDECFQTYRSGLFNACAMLSHPVNEGIIKFVIDRNGRKELHQIDQDKATVILKNDELLTPEVADASIAIYKSYRNDIHHMNPKISKIKDWHKFAKNNLRNLARVESFVFGYDMVDGDFQPHHEQYWCMGKDKLTQTVLKFN